MYAHSAIVYKVAEIAIEKLNINHFEDEEIVAIVENDSCAVDSIQVILSCTFGKGNLIFKDYGKSIECDNCGELVSGNKINELNNKQLCIPCFEKSKS